MSFRVSASNAVKVYNDCWPEPVVPPGWTVTANLRYEFIYDAFKILSLLEWYKSRNSTLVVLQGGNQAVRFNEAMQEFNSSINEYGQKEIDHRCDKCVRTIFKDGKSKWCFQDAARSDYAQLSLVLEVFAVVCDGVTVQRRCCGVPHCEVNLASTKDIFCEIHQDMNSRC